MLASMVSRMLVLGSGVACAALASGCVAQADSEGDVGEASEASIVCPIGATCPPSLYAPGVEVWMDALGQAQATSPDTSYFDSTYQLYALQADVPLNLTCTLRLLGQCRRWSSTPAYPPRSIYLQAQVAPQVALSCQDETFVLMVAEAFSPALGHWVTIGAPDARAFGYCDVGGFDLPPNAVVTLGPINLQSYQGLALTAIRVRALAQRIHPGTTIQDPLRVTVSTYPVPVY